MARLNLLFLLGSFIVALCGSVETENKCCKNIFTKNWTKYLECILYNGVPKSCYQGYNGCLYENSGYKVDEVVSMELDKCEMHRCEIESTEDISGPLFKEFRAKHPFHADSFPKNIYNMKTAVNLVRKGSSDSAGCCHKSNNLYLDGELFEVGASDPFPCITLTCRNTEWEKAEKPDCLAPQEKKPCYYAGELYYPTNMLMENPCIFFKCMNGAWTPIHSVKCPRCYTTSTGTIVPFDDKTYTVEGECNYILSKMDTTPDGFTTTITADFGQCHDSGYVCPNTVTAKVLEDLTITVSKNGTTIVNNEMVSLPYTHPQRPVLIWQEKEVVKTVTVRGLIISFDYGKLRPTVSIMSPNQLDKKDWKGLCHSSNVDGDSLQFFKLMSTETDETCLAPIKIKHGCSESEKKQHTHLCKRITDIAQEEDCDLLLDETTCMNHFCECCTKDEKECTRSCALNAGLAKCKAEQLYDTVLADAAKTFGDALKPAMEVYNCHAEEWADAVYSISSAWHSAFNDISPMLLLALRQGSPAMAEFIQNVTPNVIKLGLKMSPVFKIFLDSLPQHMHKFISNVERILTENMCMWSPMCLDFIDGLVEIRNFVIKDIAPVLQPSFNKLKKYNTQLLATMRKDLVTLLRTATHILNKNSLHTITCHLLDVIEAEFKVPCKLLSDLNVDFKKEMEKLFVKIPMLAAEEVACQNECPFKSSQCVTTAREYHDRGVNSSMTTRNILVPYYTNNTFTGVDIDKSLAHSIHRMLDL